MWRVLVFLLVFSPGTFANPAIEDLKAGFEEALNKVKVLQADIQQKQADLEATIQTVEGLKLRLDGVESGVNENNEKVKKAEQRANQHTNIKTAQVDSKANAAQNTADDARNRANKAQRTANTAVSKVNAALIRTIAYATGNGPSTEMDVGQIKSRVLRFTKTETNTKIRISYTDNLRTQGLNKGCRWEIRVDGSSCPNQALVYDDYASAHVEHTHSSRMVLGYCSGVPAGSHTIGIWVGNTPGHTGSNCATGWNNSTWVIEAEEVN